MSVTTKDIAERVGVSSRLVRYALSDYPSVAQDTRERILRVAREMGYRPGANHHARALIAKRYGLRLRCNAIAVLIPRFEPDTFSDKPFYTQVLNGIESQVNHYFAVDKVNIDLFLFSMLKPDLPRLFADGGIDGAIALTTLSPVEIEKYTEQCIPLISATVDTGRLPCLVPDDREGMRMAVRHLVELGHRRIAYLGQEPSFRNANERLAGYMEGLTEHGIESDPAIVESTITMLTNADVQVQRLLDRRADFTAIVCYNDLMAMTAVRLLQEAGVRVPKEVSVVGFDDTSVEEHFPLPLTSVHFDRAAIGKRAVQWIYAQCDEPNVAQLANEVFPVELRVRASTASAPR